MQMVRHFKHAECGCSQLTKVFVAPVKVVVLQFAHRKAPQICILHLGLAIHALGELVIRSVWLFSANAVRTEVVPA